MIVTLVLAALVAQGKVDVAELLKRAEQLDQQRAFAAADAVYRQILGVSEKGPEADKARARLEPNALLVIRELDHGGPSENRVDVYVMAEGYQRRDQEQKTFATQAELTEKLFFQVDVYGRYRKYFNFYAMHIASKDDGVDREGKDYDTALGAYQTQFAQAQVAVKHEDVRKFLDRDPHNDGLAIVIVRRGNLGTGGGGVAVVGGGASNTVIHEFGHAFAQLIDEYTGSVGYGDEKVRGYNVSDTDDPKEVPWKHWLEAKTHGIGIVPGGAGRATGEWRATGGPCAMSEGPVYCPVCREAVVANIYGLVSPLDSCTPTDQPIVVKHGAPAVIEVVPMMVANDPQLTVEFALSAVTGVTPLPKAASSRKRGEREERAFRPRWGKGADPAPA